jgi:hypothetical protein
MHGLTSRESDRYEGRDTVRLGACPMGSENAKAFERSAHTHFNRFGGNELNDSA